VETEVGLEEQTTQVVPGLEKMARDLLGRAPNAEEREIIKNAAETVHARNVQRNKEAAAAEQARKDADREQHIGMVVADVIKNKTKEREAEKNRRKVNTVTIDTMDPAKVKELCGATAPVDVELMERESLERYKKQVEIERIKFLYEQAKERR
jgi:hypothetical protein